MNLIKCVFLTLILSFNVQAQSEILIDSIPGFISVRIFYLDHANDTVWAESVEVINGSLEVKFPTPFRQDNDYPLYFSWTDTTGFTHPPGLWQYYIQPVPEMELHPFHFTPIDTFDSEW